MSQSNPAYYTTTFGVLSTNLPTLDAQMQGWIAETENMYIPGLVAQGWTSPAALAQGALQWAQGIIQTAKQVGPVPPEANMTLAAAQPYIQRIQFEAGFVPASQWTNYSVNMPGTIAEAMAAVANTAVPPPPPPPPLNAVGTCFTVNGVTMCNAAAGVNPTMFTDGEVVQSNGQTYVAHITNFLMGPELWFSPKP